MYYVVQNNMSFKFRLTFIWNKSAKFYNILKNFFMILIYFNRFTFTRYHILENFLIFFKFFFLSIIKFFKFYKKYSLNYYNSTCLWFIKFFLREEVFFFPKQRHLISNYSFLYNVRNFPRLRVIFSLYLINIPLFSFFYRKLFPKSSIIMLDFLFTFFIAKTDRTPLYKL